MATMSTPSVALSSTSAMNRASREEAERQSAAVKATKSKVQSRLLGSALAGGTELLIFHPVDTVAKRLMAHTGNIRQPGQTMHNLNAVVFKAAADKGAMTKAVSLFPGLGFAAGYKVLQRTYKFGGQPFVNDVIDKNAGSWFKRTFGDKNGKTLMQASAGSLVGVGEILLLPLDVLKIKAQTNPAAFGDSKGVGVLKFCMANPRSLYAGAGATAARNAPGSFALFGGAEATYQWAFGLKDRKHATFAQFFVASIVGSVASITVAAPLDVIKTRIQMSNFGASRSGMVVARELMRNEGAGALFKGLTPKILLVGPKLVFSFTIAQWLIAKFEKIM